MAKKKYPTKPLTEGQLIERRRRQRERASTPEGRLYAKYQLLKHRYNVSKEHADELNKVKECPICRQPFEKTLLEPKVQTWKTPHLDHDHKNKVVRGVLCGSCNIYIGTLEKNAKLGRLSKMLRWIGFKLELGNREIT